MSTLPWFKVYNEIIDEPKLCRLDDAIKWRFLQLLVLANECNADGYLCTPSYSLTAGDIAYQLRIEPKQLSRDLKALANRGLVSYDRERRQWWVPSFARRQNRQKEEERSEWRERKQRQRDRQAAGKDQTPTQAINGAASSHPEAYSEEEILPDLLPSSSEDNVTDNNAGTARALEDNVTEHHAEVSRTKDGNVTLKKRIDKKRGEKRRREERQSPSPPARPGGSVLDQLEQEIEQELSAGRGVRRQKPRWDRDGPRWQWTHLGDSHG